MEEIIDQGLNHAPIEDSETTISLVLRSDPPPITGAEGFGFDSLAVVPTKAKSLPERQP